VRESRHAAEADRTGPVRRKFVQAADLAPAEIRAEFVGEGEAQLMTGRPFGPLLSRESEEDAEVLFAEAADGDARRHRIVADKEDGPADDRATGGIALDVRRRHAGGFRRSGMADIDRELRAWLVRALMPDRRADACHALAPVGQGPGGVPFIDLRFSGQDDGRPSSGVE